MDKRITVALDAMGGDYAPFETVKGAVDAVKELNVNIKLVGPEDAVKAELAKYEYDQERIEVVHASEVIGTDEVPTMAIRRKKDSSLVVALNLVKNGEADAIVSAGSTGALLAGGLFILGRIQGIDRPTLATIYPVMGHQPSILVDTGANAECKPNNLLEFGIMGSIYMEEVLGRPNPTVGLINNGTEEGKGTTLTKAAFEMLKKSHLNFIGNIEARELQNCAADVIVTDGFTGNAIIKLTEGMGLMVLREMKKRFTETAKSKVGAVLLKKPLMGIKKEFNYAEYGGAPLLGVKGAMLKMHGSSDALAVKQTIMKAIPFVEHKVVETIQNSVLEIEEILISE